MLEIDNIHVQLRPAAGAAWRVAHRGGRRSRLSRRAQRRRQVDDAGGHRRRRDASRRRHQAAGTRPDGHAAPEAISPARRIAGAGRAPHVLAPSRLRRTCASAANPAPRPRRRGGRLRTHPRPFPPPARTRLQQPAGQLSGGEQQMLVIGRALMTQPAPGQLVDEPSLRPRAHDRRPGLRDPARRCGRRDGLTLADQRAVARSASSKLADRI